MLPWLHIQIFAKSLRASPEGCTLYIIKITCVVPPNFFPSPLIIPNIEISLDRDVRGCDGTVTLPGHPRPAPTEYVRVISHELLNPLKCFTDAHLTDFVLTS